MIISLRQSGFSGATKPLVVDTSRYDRARAARIEQQLDALDKYVKGGEQPIGADMPRYDIEVKDERGTRRLTVVHEFDEEPRALRDLLNEL
jgi:hypothetical protein